MYARVLSVFFFCKQKTAYEMRISDWSSDVCSSDLIVATQVIGIGGGVAVVAADPQTLRKTLHGVAQLLCGNIPWQYLEVLRVRKQRLRGRRGARQQQGEAGNSCKRG